MAASLSRVAVKHAYVHSHKESKNLPANDMGHHSETEGAAESVQVGKQTA